MTIKSQIQTTVTLVLLVTLLCFGGFTAYQLYFAPDLNRIPVFPQAFNDTGPAQKAGHFPFPTRFGSGPYCASQFGAAQDVDVAYQQWKAAVVTRDGANGFQRVRSPEYSGAMQDATVAHGIAYGMLMAAYFDDRDLFDDLYRYSQRWVNNRSGLMHWYVNAQGTQYCPEMVYCGAATDADQEIAFALVLADMQWGERGAWGHIYRQHALLQIDRIRQFEIDDDYVVRPGDSWGKTNFLNLSHFEPAYYEVFGDYSGDHEFWQRVIDRNYDILFETLNEANGNRENGLVPTWSTTDGRPEPPYTSTLRDGTQITAPTYYEFGAARTPFHLAQHYCWTGDPRAKKYLDKVARFFVGIGVDKIVSGYNLDGTPYPDAAADRPFKASIFYGTAASAAMINPQYKAFVERAYQALVESDVSDSYYELSWKTINLMFLTGNHIDMTRVDSGGWLQNRQIGIATATVKP